ncbi:RimK domain protein ATP-grasp [Planktothrix tepida]|uniref:RimK domain protein ATP-grasp n=2 Tax=Planktothrix TaxID=54304 RepID=A0A1J1LHK0_9CYAN|nr:MULTISPECIES: YheC/YheD family protein [Planktothrix]CAD5918027.1 RimK domain protein ATP-grasp [Planktothrix pseudagardhii]CAD5982326.1 RimK domain protein ATP-grasp [Planktothrix tepida]CUR31955.1 RimK domain protein ATP-grasp [Planktothrix tepida PCC 9214]
MLNNIRLLLQACQNLNIDYEILHSHENLIKIKLDKNYYFCNYSTPFVDQSVFKILKDKEYTYSILKEKINIPKTIGFLSPFCDEKYQEYLQFKTIPDIAREIERFFKFPVIVKRNSGSSGQNVFLCQDLEEIETALTTIFNIHDKNYDYVAIAQEYILIQREYRAVFLNQKLILLYEKDISQATFIGNLSPLHWEGGKAKYINNPQIISDIEKFCQPIFQELALDYTGLDIAVDEQNQYWFIEANSHPNYDIFTRDNGSELAVQVFEKMLTFLASKSNQNS